MGVFVLVMGAAVAVTVLSPRVYRSEAKLFVRLGRENATLDPTATLGRDPIVAVPVMRDSEINSVVEILASRSLAEQVVDALGPQTILERPSRQQGQVAASEGSTASAEALPDVNQASVGTTGLRGLVDSVDWTGWLERLNLATPLGERDRAIARLTKRLNVHCVRK